MRFACRGALFESCAESLAFRGRTSYRAEGLSHAGRLCGINTDSLTGEKGVVYYLNMYGTEEPGHAQIGG